MKKGTKFEKLTEQIFQQLIQNQKYEKVEHNVELEGKDGKRQIDVLITSNIAGFEIKTIIECKDYKNRISVGVIDALHSVMEDVNANKGIVVASNGFSSTAIKKAKRLGISLCTAHEALSDKWEIDIEIPLLIVELTPGQLTPNAIFKTVKDTNIQKDSLLVINGINLLDEFRNFWDQGDIDLSAVQHNKEFEFISENIHPPYFIKDSFGENIELTSYQFTYKVKLAYYFGYLNDKKDSKMIRDILENKFTFIFSVNNLINYKEEFTKFTENNLPQFGAIQLKCIAKPLLGDGASFSGTINVNKIA